MCVSSEMAAGPRCFRCLMFILSGPVELLLRVCLMALVVCSSVIVMDVFGSFLMFLSVVLLV